MYSTEYKCDDRGYKTFGVRTPLRRTPRYFEYELETRKWNSLIFGGKFCYVISVADPKEWCKRLFYFIFHS